jgi:hypothetical protein
MKSLLFGVSLMLCCASLVSAKPGLSGLQFPVGQPADQPAAKVSIAEITQGAQKRGFLKIALLPQVAATGVQIHFLRPDPSVFLEISETLRSLSKLDAQEFHRIECFAPGDPLPRLVAEQASPTPDGWTFKKVRFHPASAPVDVPECSLSVTGPSAGQFSIKPAHSGSPDKLAPNLPNLEDLLRAGR